MEGYIWYFSNWIFIFEIATHKVFWEILIRQVSWVKVLTVTYLITPHGLSKAKWFWFCYIKIFLTDVKKITVFISQYIYSNFKHTRHTNFQKKSSFVNVFQCILPLHCNINHGICWTGNQGINTHILLICDNLRSDLSELAPFSILFAPLVINSTEWTSRRAN